MQFPSPTATPLDSKSEHKKKGGCELVFYCSLEFSGTLITHKMQIQNMQEILREFFEKLKERVEQQA